MKLTMLSTLILSTLSDRQFVSCSRLALLVPAYDGSLVLSYEFHSKRQHAISWESPDCAVGFIHIDKMAKMLSGQVRARKGARCSRTHARLLHRHQNHCCYINRTLNVPHVSSDDVPAMWPMNYFIYGIRHLHFRHHIRAQSSCGGSRRDRSQLLHLHR